MIGSIVGGIIGEVVGRKLGEVGFTAAFAAIAPPESSEIDKKFDLGTIFLLFPFSCI